jgi:hypothetical protein
MTKLITFVKSFMIQAHVSAHFDFCVLSLCILEQKIFKILLLFEFLSIIYICEVCWQNHWVFVLPAFIDLKRITRCKLALIFTSADHRKFLGLFGSEVARL